ncbi:hypothetical protein [Rheinheimera sp.]|uniref:hypothetical protein n=1 Tax=Rheinheimera sp. TaxID=1869214 RepID=UPI004047E2C2
MKLILSALLLCGAFFSCYVTAQDTQMPVYSCNNGGTLHEDKCIEVAQGVSGWTLTVSPGYPYAGYQVEAQTKSEAQAALGQKMQTDLEARSDLQDGSGSFGGYNCSYSKTYTFSYYLDGENSTVANAHATQIATPWAYQGSCPPASNYTNRQQAVVQAVHSWEQNEIYQCPPDAHPQFTAGPIEIETVKYCYYSAELLPPDEEPPPGCENDPLNPCPPPPCVPGGGGMMVCKYNPDDKCWLDAFGQTQCEEGCGFINDEFFCTVPGDDNPSFEKCKFTFNGYACPSEPDDELTDPEKNTDQMTKADHKEVNKGIETRQDVTNDLLQTQLAEWSRESNETQQGLADLNSNLGGKLNTANGYLSDMSETLTDIGDFLKSADGAIDPPPPEPESWYESEYEDGITGIWEERSAALMQTPIFDFMNQFKMAPSGSQPEFRLCFNFIVDLGCHTPEIPAGLWAFLRIIILITAAFGCRKIIMGG